MSAPWKPSATNHRWRQTSYAAGVWRYVCVKCPATKERGPFGRRGGRQERFQRSPDGIWWQWPPDCAGSKVRLAA